MKAANRYVFLLALILICGCATGGTLNRTYTRTHTNAEGEVVIDQKGQPGFYLLLPFAVAWDIVTSPFQIPVFIIMMQPGAT